MEKKGSQKTKVTNTSKKNARVKKAPVSKKGSSKKNENTFFWERVTINSLIFIVLVASCFFAATKAIERQETKPISYTDTNKIEYKVYLKDNEFYKDEYLGMNRAYVANLIDHIDIDYSYLFNIERVTKMGFNYRIIAQLIIENSKGVSFVDEKYVVKDTISKNIDNTGTFAVNEHAVIDYGYYNYLANKFKVETGVDIVSYLNVYLEVDKKTDESLNYSINETTKANIKIPLSERALEINFNANNLESTKSILPSKITVINYQYLTLEIVLFILSSMFIALIIKDLASLKKKRTAYDRYVDKLLKSYDRLIVETKTKFDMSNYNVTSVNSFNELLDVRDNLKLPIVYYNIIEHKKGIFYIKNNKDVFSLIVVEKNANK